MPDCGSSAPIARAADRLPHPASLPGEIQAFGWGREVFSERPCPSLRSDHALLGTFAIGQRNRSKAWAPERSFPAHRRAVARPPNRSPLRCSRNQQPRSSGSGASGPLPARQSPHPHVDHAPLHFVAHRAICTSIQQNAIQIETRAPDGVITDQEPSILRGLHRNATLAPAPQRKGATPCRPCMTT